MGGVLHKKLTGRNSTWTTWKPRYFALTAGTSSLLCGSSLITALKRMITAGQLAFYATEKDLYDEEGDPLGVIPLSSIQRVFTSADPKPHQGHGFEVFLIQNETH